MNNNLLLLNPIKIVFSFVILLTFYSCSKKQQDECISEKFTKTPTCLYDFLFEENSYWIYQDTTTMEIDSVWVSSWKYTKAMYPESVTGSNYDIDDGADWFCHYIDEYIINYSRSSLNSLRPSVEHIHGYQYLTYYGKSPCENIIDSLTTRETTYYNVGEILSTNRSFWFKPDIGIIRITYKDSATFDLINHNVNLFSPQ